MIRLLLLLLLAMPALGEQEILIFEVGTKPPAGLVERLKAYAVAAGRTARVGLPAKVGFEGRNGKSGPDGCLIDTRVMPLLEKQAREAGAFKIAVTDMPLYNAEDLKKTFGQSDPPPDVEPRRIAFWGQNSALLSTYAMPTEELFFMLFDHTLARAGSEPRNWGWFFTNPRKLVVPVPELSAPPTR
ncbi:MAG: hypothetical protein AMXMBFR33_30040 [Candidatus Xenobia bacterium]|jgi:hypothetical protein